jgi:hypothetical protein
MTVRVEGAPSGLPPVVLEVVGLGDGEQYDVRAAGVRVVIRQGHRRVVASRSGHVLKSGLDSSRIRVRYSTPPSLSLGPPDSVSLRIALRQGAPLDATEVLDFPSIPIALETRPADQDHP